MDKNPKKKAAIYIHKPSKPTIGVYQVVAQGGCLKINPYT